MPRPPAVLPASRSRPLTPWHASTRLGTQLTPAGPPEIRWEAHAGAAGWHLAAVLQRRPGSQAIKLRDLTGCARAAGLTAVAGSFALGFAERLTLGLTSRRQADGLWQRLRPLRQPPGRRLFGAGVACRRVGPLYGTAVLGWDPRPQRLVAAAQLGLHLSQHSRIALLGFAQLGPAVSACRALGIAGSLGHGPWRMHAEHSRNLGGGGASAVRLRLRPWRAGGRSLTLRLHAGAAGPTYANPYGRRQRHLWAGSGRLQLRLAAWQLQLQAERARRRVPVRAPPEGTLTPQLRLRWPQASHWRLRLAWPWQGPVAPGRQPRLMLSWSGAAWRGLALQLQGAVPWGQPSGPAGRRGRSRRLHTQLRWDHGGGRLLAGVAAFGRSPAVTLELMRRAGGLTGGLRLRLQRRASWMPDASLWLEGSL